MGSGKKGTIRSTNKEIDGRVLPENEIQAIQESTGTPLPENVRSTLEAKLNADFSSVRVHHGQNAFRLAETLGAEAFTLGQDIFFSPGNYDPHSESGQRILAHELAHSLQQKGNDSE